jgi:HAD superfamily hydrolase (TIGR01509 family)
VKIQPMEQPDRSQPCTAVIWDVGGTLVDRVVSPGEGVKRALQAGGICPDAIRAEALERAQQRYLEIEPRWRTLAEEEQGFREIAGCCLEGLDAAADPARIERLGQHFGDYFSVYHPVPGIPELLEELGQMGFRQAVASNWPPSLSRFLGYHDLDQHFAVIVGSGTEGLLKPDPAFFHRVVERLNVPPEQAIFIGNDPDLDILPARGVGLRAAHFDPRRQHPGADAHDVATLREHLFAMLGQHDPGE